MPLIGAIPDLLPVLRGAWERPFSTRSDFARNHTDEIAIASCLGLITVQRAPQSWGRIWRITASGLARLNITQASPEIIQ